MREATREIEKYQPLWGSWRVAELMSQESDCELYRVYKDEWGKQYVSTVKLLSFLVGKKDIREAQTLGLDPAEMPEYFKNLVGNIQNEIELMYRLRGNSNIVAYEDHVVYEKKDRQGWDVLIRMEYLQPLPCIIDTKELEPAEVVRLGTDVCRALEACAREGIIHRDIKASSIFVSPRGEYKLGNFGMAKELTRGVRTAMASLSPLYMAPELYKEQGYDYSADLYSLGMVMYKLLNRGRLPFLPLPPVNITADSVESALTRRMSGEELLPPVDAGESLGAIILKACSYDKKDRYRSPAELRQKLERFQKAGVRATKAYVSAACSISDYTLQETVDKEEPDTVEEYEKELEKLAVVELAASVEKINEGKKQKEMRLIRNIAICAAVLVIVFIAAYVSAYEAEPIVEKPADKATSITLQVSPSPIIESTPTPQPEAVAAKSGEEYYKEGQNHMKHGRYWSAIAAFEEAKKMDYEVKKTESQIRAARKSIETQKLNASAMKLYEQKEYAKAIAAFAELAKTDPEAKSLVQYPDCYFRLAEGYNLAGVKYHNEGKLDSSMKEFDAAIGMLDRLKSELQNYDRQRLDEKYGIYTQNKNSLLEKKQKIEEYTKLADQCNRAGVQYFSEDSLDEAKLQFEQAVEYLRKIRLLASEYKESRYTSLQKICEDNLKSIEARLESE